MISQRARYAFKAVVALARAKPGVGLQIRELCEQEKLPRKFLEQILLELKRHGMVHSKKGKGGGYFLRRAPAEVTFGDVIRVLEGPLAAVPCVSERQYMKCIECVDEFSCGVRLAMKEVRDATAGILDNTTLADVNARVARKRIARKRQK